MEVLEQMLAAISPPQTLASSRAAGSQPSLPAGIRAVQAGELVADALHPWCGPRPQEPPPRHLHA